VLRETAVARVIQVSAQRARRNSAVTHLMKLHRLAATMIVPLLASCGIIESNPGPKVDVSAVTAPLDLAIGDTVRITITVRNVGDREVSIGTTGCNTEFLISDLQGNAYVPAELVYCTLELRAPTKLAPGEVHNITVFTTGRVVPQGSQAAPAMLPKGTYRLRPVVQVLVGDESAVLVAADPALVTFR
jgi:hypothetical protein